MKTFPLSESRIKTILSVQTGGLFRHNSSFIDERFKAVHQAVAERWNVLAKDVDFPTYQQNRSDESLAKEFNCFNALRRHFHYQVSSEKDQPVQVKSDFEFAQALLADRSRYRQPNCVTFEHSKTDDSYNSSCLEINGRRFFALEGPTERTEKAFFHLLLNWNVKTLVCLTGESENGHPKCFPYWNNRIKEKEGQLVCEIPIEGQYQTAEASWPKKAIQFLHIPDWKDHQGCDIETLISALNEVRSNTAANEILAIHCSAGVGRTGTFLCALALLEEVDRQLAEGVSKENIRISVAEYFTKINFYRRPLVAKEPQYILLYRVLDTYLEQHKSAVNSVGLNFV